MSNDQQPIISSSSPNHGAPDPTPNSSPADPPAGRPRALDDAKRRDVLRPSFLLAAAWRSPPATSAATPPLFVAKPDAIQTSATSSASPGATASFRRCRPCTRPPNGTGARCLAARATHADRFAKIAPQTITLDQFEEYNLQIQVLMRHEVRGEFVWMRLFHTFSQIRDHFVSEITARRNPLPIPNSVTQLDESPGSPYDEELRVTKEAIEWARQSKVSDNE